MNQLEKINFHGQEMLAVKEADRVLVPVKRICENLGLNYCAQKQLIDRDEVLAKGVCIIHVPTHGGVQKMVCLPLDLIPGWLFQIPAARYPELKREVINLYRRECFKALSDHFLGGNGRIDELSMHIGKIADSLNRFTETTLRFMETVDRRLDLLEKKFGEFRQTPAADWRYSGTPSDPAVQITDDLYRIIKFAVDRLGSRRAFCEQTGISKQALSCYLTCKANTMRPETFQKLRRVIDDLFE